MASRNYIKGRSFEYRVMSYLRGKGYYCIRAYASKGVFDIIAIPRRTGIHPRIEGLENLWYHLPLLIQCKTNGKIGKQERDRLKDAEKWNGLIIKAWINNHQIQFETMDGIIIPL